MEVQLRDQYIERARNQLDAAIEQALETLLIKWAAANNLTLSKRTLEEAIEKLVESAV